MLAISTCIEGSGIDVLFGIGGAPEGVLAAAAFDVLAAICKRDWWSITTKKVSDAIKWASKISIKNGI